MAGPKMTVQLALDTGSNFTEATSALKSMRDKLVAEKASKGEVCYVAELGIEPKKCKGGSGGGGRGGPRNKRNEKCRGGGLQLHGYSDKQWHDLSADKKEKINALCTAEKAKKREAETALTKTDGDKDAEKRGSKFGKGAHA
jgi:hypothetical protein